MPLLWLLRLFLLRIRIRIRTAEPPFAPLLLLLLLLLLLTCDGRSMTQPDAGSEPEPGGGHAAPGGGEGAGRPWRALCPCQEGRRGGGAWRVAEVQYPPHPIAPTRCPLKRGG